MRRGRSVAAPRLLRAAAWVVSAALLLGASSPAESFRNVEVGDAIPNPRLRALDGGRGTLLQSERQANVFVFFRPDQEQSARVLEELAECEREFAGRSVRWVLVVSERTSKEEMAPLLESSGFSSPILVDEAGELHGALGVVVQPSAGVTDSDFRLVASQPYNKLRFTTLLRAQVRHLLGEIDDAELERILSPPRESIASDDAADRRQLRFAEVLLDRGRFEKALERARPVAEARPDWPEVHAVIGACLAGLEDCAAAVEAFDQALALDPANERAVTGRAACAGD